MVDTLGLGPSAARCGGSSPLPPTKCSFEDYVLLLQRLYTLRIFGAQSLALGSQPKLTCPHKCFLEKNLPRPGLGKKLWITFFG